MVEDGKGFLGRWARRKTDALQGKPPDEPALVAKPAAADRAAVNSSSSGLVESGAAAVPPSAGAVAGAPPPEEKTLSLDDVKLLTKDSDFKPFMASNVGAEVRNAAMKKLFADPHFNVMDGLDIYIGDYSQPDPVSPSMLRQMVGAKFLNLFDEEEKNGPNEQREADKQGRPGALAQEIPHEPNTEVMAQPSGKLQATRQADAGTQALAQLAPSPVAAAGQPESGPRVLPGDRGAL